MIYITSYRKPAHKIEERIIGHRGHPQVRARGKGHCKEMERPKDNVNRGQDASTKPSIIHRVKDKRLRRYSTSIIIITTIYGRTFNYLVDQTLLFI